MSVCMCVCVWGGSTEVASTPATEPRITSLLSGSTIESVLENVMFSGLSGRLKAIISHSSEGHSMPDDRVRSDDAAGTRSGRKRNRVVAATELGRPSLSTVSGSLIQFSGIVTV